MTVVEKFGYLLQRIKNYERVIAARAENRLYAPVHYDSNPALLIRLFASLSMTLHSTGGVKESRPCPLPATQVKDFFPLESKEGRKEGRKEI